MNLTDRYLAASELAGLPGQPATKSGVIRLAKRESWTYRQRQGRGGGREYAFSSLPAETRRYLEQKALRDLLQAQPTTAIEQPQPVELPQVAELADWQREIMHARLAICALVDTAIAHGGSANKAIAELLAAANDGTLAAETIATLRTAHARQGKRDRLPDAATLYRWLSARKEGVTALAPKAPPREPMPVWFPPLLKLYQSYPPKTVAACLREWGEYYPTIPAPNARTANRHIGAMPVELREHGRRGRRAMRAVQPFVRRTTDGLWPMDVVTVDGHLFKAYVRHPMTGRKQRPETTTYVDVATRRAIGFSAWLAESQMAIWAALRDMVLNPECGIPALHYSDNGAYRGEQHRAVMERIGSSLMYSEAYRAQARGVIERLNSSVWVPLARTLPTYVNDDSDAELTKRALRIADTTGANLPTWQEFTAKARQALDDYNNRPHRHLKGKTPNEAWAQAVAEGWRPTLLEADDLHDLLPSQRRRVNRGWVTLPWGHYFHDSLVDYHERHVVVGVHPTDGSRVWCSTENGALICVAVRDANSKPYVPQSMLEDARAKREAGKIKRLERKIAAAREEGAAVIDLPQADVAALRPQPLPALRNGTDVDPQYDTWFNSVISAQIARLRKDSIDTPTGETDEGRSAYQGS